MASVVGVVVPPHYFEDLGVTVPASARSVKDGYTIPMGALIDTLRELNLGDTVVGELMVSPLVPIPYVVIRHAVGSDTFLEQDDVFVSRLAYDTHTPTPYIVVVSPTDPLLSTLVTEQNPNTGTFYAFVWDYVRASRESPATLVRTLLPNIPRDLRDNVLQYVVARAEGAYTLAEMVSNDPLPAPTRPSSTFEDRISRDLLERARSRTLNMGVLTVESSDVIYYYAGKPNLMHSTYLGPTIPLLFSEGTYHVYAAAPQSTELYESVLREPTRGTPYGRVYLDKYHRTYYEGGALTVTDLTSAVPLPYGEPNYTTNANLTVSWHVYGVEVDFALFAHALMVDKEFVRYFSVNEPDKPYFLKNNQDFYFQWWEHRYHVLLHRMRPLSGEVSIVSEAGLVGIAGVEASVSLVDIPYITLTVSNVPTLGGAFALQRALTYFLYQFIERQPALVTEYASVFPAFRPRYLPHPVRAAEGGNLLQVLKQTAPDVFVQDYARSCQVGRQPIPLDASELDDWRARGLHYMLYPHDPVGGRQWYFACTNPKYKYIGVRENIDLRNRTEYADVPCCFAKPQLTNTHSRAHRQGYRLYGEGQAFTHVEATPLVFEPKSEISRVDKVLSTGRVGKLPSNIVRTLMSYGFADVRSTIVRRGVLPSVNSLIHCVMFAVIGSDYISDRTSTELELIATNWRRWVAGLLEDDELDEVVKDAPLRGTPEGLRTCVRQEVYDLTDAEVVSEFADVHAPYDSYRLYRALEEAFGVNVFVFTVRDEDAVLEIPRHLRYHIRHPNARPSVVVFKHDDGVTYELVTGDTPDDHLTERLFDMYYTYYTTFTIRTQSPPVENENSYVDVRRELVERDFVVTGQYLDVYRKTRGYRVSIDGTVASVLCLPQQPSTDPIVTELVNAPHDFFNATTEDVSDGVLRGVWVDLSPEVDPLTRRGYMCYVPVIPVPAESVTLTPANPLVPPARDGAFVTHLRAERELNTLLTVITALYRLYYRRSSPRMGDEAIHRLFLERLVVRPVRYDLDALDLRRLSETNDYTVALGLVGRASNIALGEYIQLRDTETRDDLRYYCTNYLFKQPLSFYILPYRPAMLDEVSVRHLVFTTLDALERWVLSMVGTISVVTDPAELRPAHVLPYVFLHPSAGMFLIQNVANGDLTRALAVCANWASGRNTGYDTPSSGWTEHTRYVVGISGIEVVERTPSSPYNVLDLGEGVYAALLPFR